ncbi:MAG: 3-deoxy-7-phosphoheptulonate synthase class II [Pseudomonadota bacterium]
MTKQNVAPLSQSKPQDAIPGQWQVNSWKTKLTAQQVIYEDQAKLKYSIARLETLPPLVTSWEIERLRSLIADAQQGKRFLLQGGDCAETLADCTADAITAKLKILLQMSLVLVHASKQPVIKVGRFAGQYAKPRSSATETRRINGQEVTLPSYFGDLVNKKEFDPDSRRPDPYRMVKGYKHAGMTLNFIRSLMEGGFADLHHPEYWDLGFLSNAALPPELRESYQSMVASLSDALRFTEALGERDISELHRAEFFTSHEGLNLLYESAQTRTVPRRQGYYNLTTHLPWIGERTRQLDGAHIEYFRGINNPVGVKIGPTMNKDELIRLIDILNPTNQAGKLVLITRLGAEKVDKILPMAIEAVNREGRIVLWVCDPMHSNAATTAEGIKTRRFYNIRKELEATWDIHEQLGSQLGGMHIELTGEDVTECVGGASGLTEADLSRNYATACDPRLNYQQSLELALLLAKRMKKA